MRKLLILAALSALTTGLHLHAASGLAYGPPPGGWQYFYDGVGTQGATTSGAGAGRNPGVALDGTWNGNNGSSEFDGSWRGVGNGQPGGISSSNGVLTIEDINNGSGTGNNRKIFFTHDLAREAAAGLTNANTILDTGITLSFRLRLTPSTDPLLEGAAPDGWGIFSDGKGNVQLHQFNNSVHSSISFSLVRQSEPDNSLNFMADGLTWNRLNGNVSSGGGAANSSGTAASNPILPLDLTEWHEFWVTIQTNQTANPGTHTVTIYIDGNPNPAIVTNCTAATGNENTLNYLGIGLNNSGGRGVVDYDFVAYRQGVHLPCTPPATPSAIETQPGDGSVTLNWGTAAGAASYEVFRATSFSGPFGLVGSPETASYTDTGLVNGTPYYYRIGALSADGCSSISDTVSATPVPAPVPPASLTALSGDHFVALSWPAVPFSSGYFVRRSEAPGGPYAALATVATPGFTDTSVANDVVYYYVVASFNPIGTSANSREAVGEPRLAPAGLSAVGGFGMVNLTWTPLDGVSGYNVKRGTSALGPFTTIAAGIATASHDDLSVTSGTEYYYVVSATTIDGETGNSASASAVTGPGTPTDPAATLEASPGLPQVTVNWTLPDPAIASFQIERSVNGNDFVPLATVAGGLRTYADASVGFDTTYSYRIRAVNGTGASAFSAPASLTTPLFRVSVNFQLATTTTPAGYLADAGLAFGDRANGFNYGWDVDNTANARERFSANSPNKLLDTFNHLQKPLPAGRVWEIEVPNGAYRIGAASGDPDNFDSVFDLWVEDVQVVSGAASTGNRFFFGSNVVTVVDGRLSVSNGPAASNNKISYIQITGIPEIAPVIGQQPVSLVITQADSAVFSVVLSDGVPPFAFQWYYQATPKDAPEAVPGASGPTLTLPNGQPGNNGWYYVVVGNNVGETISDKVQLTVIPDTEGPVADSTGSLDGTTIGVCFNEPVTVNSGAAPTSYLVDDGVVTVLSANLSADGKTAVLTVSGISPVAGTMFKVDATELVDRTGNIGSTTVFGTVLGITGGDVGTPAQAGSSVSCADGAVDVVAGGADIWGTADQGHLTLGTRTGRFDVRVQVAGLTLADAISKAGLMVRENWNADSPTLTALVNPLPPGRDLGQLGLRPTAGAATAGWGSAWTPAGIPNAWIRITRSGSTFDAYRSTNGSDWILMGTTNQPFPDSVLVGLATSAHNNNVAPTVALYRNLHFVPPPFISTPPQTACVAAGGSLTLSVNSTSETPVTYQWRHNGQPIEGATAATLTLNPVAAGAAGSYDVVLSNSGGDSTSAAAAVTVLAPFAVTGTSYQAGAGTATLSVATTAGCHYRVEYTDALAVPVESTVWTELTTVPGTGAPVVITDPAAPATHRFYRVLALP